MLFALMRGGRLEWYDLVFLMLAVPMVFPDKILDQIGETTGWFGGRIHQYLLVVAAFAGMAITMALLMEDFPKLPWWHPGVHLTGLFIVRLATMFVCWMLGYEEDDLG